MVLTKLSSAIACIVIACMLVSLTACGTSQVTTTLQLVIAAAEAAVGALASTGSIPPATVANIDNYLSAVSQATSYAATELASTDSSAVKAEKIIARFAQIAAPNLPPGLPQTIVAVIQAVVQAVTNFLATVQPAAPTALRTASIPQQIKISGADRNTLQLIKTRADALQLRIALTGAK